MTPLAAIQPEPLDLGSEIVSYALDMWFDDISVLTDLTGLLNPMYEAAAQGKANVLAEATHVFPNGAVTAVLVLSSSHFSVHSWPEFGGATFDLLTCGVVSGDAIIEHLIYSLGPTRIRLRQSSRDLTEGEGDAPH